MLGLEWRHGTLPPPPPPHDPPAHVGQLGGERGGAGGSPLAGRVRGKQSRPVGRKASHDGASGAHTHTHTHTHGGVGGARTTPQAPGGSHPPNTGTGHTRARSHTATDRLAGDGHRISPPPDGHGERGWTATRHGGPAPWGEAEPGGEGTPPPHRPDRPDPKADGRPPLGVFKPPRRDALGTWREGGGRGGAGRGGKRRTQAPPTTAGPDDG